MALPFLVPIAWALLWFFINIERDGIQTHVQFDCIAFSTWMICLYNTKSRYTYPFKYLISCVAGLLPCTRKQYSMWAIAYLTRLTPYCRPRTSSHKSLYEYTPWNKGKYRYSSSISIAESFGIGSACLHERMRTYRKCIGGHMQIAVRPDT